jgi:hypothetical protein
MLLTLKAAVESEREKANYNIFLCALKFALKNKKPEREYQSLT